MSDEPRNEAGEPEAEREAASQPDEPGAVEERAAAEQAEPGQEQEAGREQDAGPEQEGEPVVQEREPVLKGQAGIEGALVWISAFLIVIAGVVAYSNCLGVPFHWESKALVVESDAVHGVLTVPEAMTPETPRLLPMLSLSACWRVTPGSAALFHVVDLVLHLACGVLIFLLARRLLRGTVPEPVAMLAGLLFVLHPANTQAVNDIVSRPVLMATAFGLLCLLMYLRATRDVGKVHAWPLGISFAAFFAAWLSHSSAVVIPVLLWGAGRVAGGGAKGRWRIQASYWGLAVAFLFAQWAARTQAPLPAGERLAAWAQTLVPYAELTVLRRPLCALHAYPIVGSLTGMLGVTTVAIGVALVLLAVGSILVRRALPGLAVLWFVLALAAGAWFAGPDAPALAEPRLYPALAGLVLLVPWLFAVALKQGAIRTAGGVGFAVLVIAAGTTTFLRNTVWQEEASLWADVAAKTWTDSPSPLASNETHARAQHYLGVLEREAGEAALQVAAHLAQDGMEGTAQQERDMAAKHFEAAEPRLREALELMPDDPEVLSELGVVLEYQGKRDEALEVLLEAVKGNPYDAKATARVAALLHGRAAATGDGDELRRALDYYKRAERLAPLDTSAVMSYGMALAQVGDLASAERALRHVVEEGQASAEANALRGVRGTLRRSVQLQREAGELLTKDPRSAEGLEKMVQALLLQKDLLKASYLLEALMKSGGVTPLRWATMGYIRAKMGAVEAFLAEWPEAPKAAGEQRSGWALVVPMCASEGMWEAAETYANAGAGLGEVEHPMVLLGQAALQMRQAARAEDYLERATQADGENATPWVLLSSLALARGDVSSAKRLVGEAEKRGADAETLAPIRERLKGVPEGEGDKPMTIMR